MFCIISVKLSNQTEIKPCICVPLSDKWVHFCGKTWNQIRVRILAAPLRAFVPPAQPVYGLRAAAISGAAEAFLSWKNKSSSVFVCSFTSTCGLYTYSLRPLSRPPCKRSQTQADAELQLLNQKATMCLHIHEWKGQLETQTLSMCLRARCTHSTDFYSEKYNIFQKDSSHYVCCSWRHLRCAKPHENI